MTAGITNILSIIQPETPSAGAETGAGGADAKGGTPTPDKEDGGDASGREGRRGETGQARDAEAAVYAVPGGADKATLRQRLITLGLSDGNMLSAGL